jgi:hypothetical protein
MQFTWRRLAGHETDHELLWLIVSAGSLAAASIWFALRLPWPICAFHELTGLPCLTCGATRCAIAFFHGDLVAAWLWNPFVLLALGGFVLFDAYALAVLVLRAPRLRIRLCAGRARSFARSLLVAALAINWSYLLAHSQKF